MTRIDRLRGAFLVASVLLGTHAAAQSASGVQLVDLSESGEALVFATSDARTEIRMGPAAAWDVLDFEVSDAAVGQLLRFVVPAPPVGFAPSVTAGDHAWDTVRVLPHAQETERTLEVAAPRERFIVRLVPRTGVDAAYYTWDRFVTYMGEISNEPLAQVTQVGQSIQGRPLMRIVIDDPSFSSDRKTVVMVARQHGDEFGSSYVVEGVLDHLLDRRTADGRGTRPLPGPLVGGLATGRAKALRGLRWVIYPFMNPDGAVANQRYNANGVDLNRDWDRNGCNVGQEPETFAIQCDIENVQQAVGISIAGDHHGWGGGTHGGFRYALAQSVSFVTTPEYDESKKHTDLITLHDPAVFDWQENGGTAGMMRSELFLRYGIVLHTPEYDSFLSTPDEFRRIGRNWTRAMYDTLHAVRFTNVEGRPLRSATLSTGVFVTVDDLDEDSTGSNDSVSVSVFDQASGDIESLTLIEIGLTSGVFRNTSALMLTTGPAVPGDGVLQTSAGASIVARYVDDDFADDASSSRLPIR
jgi:hypothetical protein